jgi:hypothetical protein
MPGLSASPAGPASAQQKLQTQEYVRTMAACASKLTKAFDADTMQMVMEISMVWPLQQQSCLNLVVKWSRNNTPQAQSAVCAKYWSRHA